MFLDNDNGIYMIEKPEVKPINWVDQGAHFGSCFAFTLITLGFGAPIVVLWAITREYYQTKLTMFEVYLIQQHEKGVGLTYELMKVVEKQLKYGVVMEKVDLAKRDLVVSYWGVVAGLAIAVPFDLWLF